MDSQFRSRQDTLKDIVNSSHITHPFLSCPTIFPPAKRVLQLPRKTIPVSFQSSHHTCSRTPLVIVLPLSEMGRDFKERCPNSSQSHLPAVGIASTLINACTIQSLMACRSDERLILANLRSPHPDFARALSARSQSDARLRHFFP